MKYIYAVIFIVFNVIAACFMLNEFWLVFEELKQPFQSLGRLFLAGLIALVITVWVFYSFYRYVLTSVCTNGDFDLLKRVVKNKTQIFIAWSFLLVTTVAVSCLLSLMMFNFSLTNIAGLVLGFYAYCIYKINANMVYERISVQVAK